MQFRLANLDIHGFGADANTPPGHVTALGRDPLGNIRLFLWAGDKPDDNRFVGSILIPQEPGRPSIAYGQHGGFVGISGTEAEKLAKLVTRYNAAS